MSRTEFFVNFIIIVSAFLFIGMLLVNTKSLFDDVNNQLAQEKYRVESTYYTNEVNSNVQNQPLVQADTNQLEEINNRLNSIDEHLKSTDDTVEEIGQRVEITTDKVDEHLKSTNDTVEEIGQRVEITADKVEELKKVVERGQEIDVTHKKGLPQKTFDVINSTMFGN